VSCSNRCTVGRWRCSLPAYSQRALPPNQLQSTFKSVSASVCQGLGNLSLQGRGTACGADPHLTAAPGLPHVWLRTPSLCSALWWRWPHGACRPCSAPFPCGIYLPGPLAKPGPTHLPELCGPAMASHMQTDHLNGQRLVPQVWALNMARGHAGAQVTLACAGPCAQPLDGHRAPPARPATASSLSRPTTSSSLSRPSTACSGGSNSQAYDATAIVGSMQVRQRLRAPRRGQGRGCTHCARDCTHCASMQLHCPPQPQCKTRPHSTSTLRSHFSGAGCDTWMPGVDCHQRWTVKWCTILEPGAALIPQVFA